MTIGSLMSRMGTAEKLSIPQIQQAIKDGSLPAYVGVPMLQEKMKMQQVMQAGQQQPQQQPPIAQEVMQQADSMGQGIPQLQSNLPPQGMAGGGIVAFAEGGYGEDDEDESDMAEANGAMDDAAVAQAIMRMQQRPMNQSPSRSAAPAPMDMSGAMDDSATGRAINSYVPEEARGPGKPVKGQHKYHDQIVSMAQKIGLDPAFALKIANKETGNLSNPESAVSRAGALGVMQLMPKTAEGLGVKDPMNPMENIAGGLQYAKQMRDKYGDEKLAAMAYNYGPGNIDKWMKSGKGIEALPRETRNYGNVFAEGGIVQHLEGGGTPLLEYTPRAVDPEAVRMNAEAKARLAQEKIAERARAMRAAPSAPVGGTPTGAPANYAPSAGYSRLLGLGIPAAVGLGGAGITKLVGNYMNRLGPEGLEALSSYPDETGLGASILNSQNMTPAAPTKFPNLGIMDALTYTPSDDNKKPAAGLPGNSNAGGGRGSNPGATRGPMPGEVIANPFKDAPAEAFESNFTGSDVLSNPNAPAAQATKEEAKQPSSMDEYMKMLQGGYEDIKKQKEEDKYLALLAAGLGMMSGTSPHAAANIGSGAMHGVSALMESNKQRAAEKAALDRSYGQSLYRQSLGDINAASRAAQLQELIRNHDLVDEQRKARSGEAAGQHAQANLANAIKLVEGAFAKDINNIGKGEAERNAYVYSHPLVKKAATAAGLDVSGLESPGKPQYTEKQQSMLDKYLK